MRNLKETKEALEKTVTIGKVAVIVGLAVFGPLMHLTYVDWATVPKETQVEMDWAVENILSEERISVFPKAYLRNEFVESVSLGRAGGMGNNVVGSKNAQDFIETIRRNNIKEAYCVYERDKHRFIKRYWALSPGGIHELKQVYTAPRRNNLYSPREYNENMVIFEIGDDTTVQYWTWVAIICAVIGMIAGGATYAVLNKIYYTI